MPAVPVATKPAMSVAASNADGRYQVGQPISVTVTLSNSGSIAGTFNRSEYLQDYFGNQTTVLSDTLTLAAGAQESSTVPVQITGTGYFEFHASLTDQATQQQATAFAVIGVLPQQPAASLDSQSAYGSRHGGRRAIHGSGGHTLRPRGVELGQDPAPGR
jgi:hypothetical protein